MGHQPVFAGTYQNAKIHIKATVEKSTTWKFASIDDNTLEFIEPIVNIDMGDLVPGKTIYKKANLKIQASSATVKLKISDSNNISGSYFQLSNGTCTLGYSIFTDPGFNRKNRLLPNKQFRISVPVNGIISLYLKIMVPENFQCSARNANFFSSFSISIYD
jgi:hypothetical protein